MYVALTCRSCFCPMAQLDRDNHSTGKPRLDRLFQYISRYMYEYMSK